MSMATDRERDLFASDILASVGRYAATLPPSPLTGFLAMEGLSYRRGAGLMVVGRAVNGWTEEILPHALATVLECTRYAQVVQNSVNGSNACPMLWVTKRWGPNDVYNTKRSAFWQSIRGVVRQLHIAYVQDVDRDRWPSHLVWSNLYKVSPANGGNPIGPLCDVQKPGCIDLLELELETYKPSRILFLTGIDWANPFFKWMTGVPSLGGPLHHVERFGTYTISNGHKIQWVVATHPQGKPEAEWIGEVAEAYNRL